MGTKYAVFGLGLMGKAICYDLLTEDSQSEVIGLEFDVNRINAIRNEFALFENRFTAFQINLTLLSDEELIEFLKVKQINVAFGAIDYKHNRRLTELCIQAKVHFLDLGGNPEVVKSQYELNSLAKEAQVTIIPDCGLAPGMANIVASGIMERFDSLDSCHIRVGGLPQYPRTILKYQQVFSIRGLTNEYLEDAIVIRNGKIQQVKSLTEIETIKFPDPFGELEAFQTAGGTSMLPNLYEGKINDLDYKTIRYKGHVQFFQFLKEFGFLSEAELNGMTPRKLSELLLQKHLPKNEPDVVLVRIIVSGSIGEKQTTVVSELIDYYDGQTGYSAMARTTAFPISIIGQMIAKGEIVQRGVLPGEVVVPKERFDAELKKRKIVFNEQSLH